MVHRLAVRVTGLIVSMIMRMTPETDGEIGESLMLIGVPGDEMARVCGIHLLALKFALNTFSIRSVANERENRANPFNKL